MSREKSAFCLLIVVCSFILAIPVIHYAQIVATQPTFGHALYAAGYTTTIAKGPLHFDPSAPLSQRVLRGVFNPNATKESQDGNGNSGRWTFPGRAKGPIGVGPEGFSGQRLSNAIANGCLVEVARFLPVGYIYTDLDAQDGVYVAHGSRSIWDYCIAIGTDHPPVSPEPSPTPCSACPACPECPPVRVCEPCPEPTPCSTPVPCPAPVLCPTPPARCLDTIDALQTRMLPLGPGLRAGVRACKEYFKEMALRVCLQ